MSEMRRDEFGVLLAGPEWKRSIAVPARSNVSAEIDDLSLAAAWALLCEMDLPFEMHYLGGLVESPPEKAFLLAFIARAAREVGDPCTRVLLCPEHEALWGWGGPQHPGLGGSGAYEICPQHAIGRFRVDFWVRSLVDGGRQVVVEIDGHEFHEKTRRQVTQDKRRERAIVAAGFSVLRFSGSDVFRDASSCAEEVIAYLRTTPGRLPVPPSNTQP